jgi:hypothetical protein
MKSFPLFLLTNLVLFFSPVLSFSQNAIKCNEYKYRNCLSAKDNVFNDLVIKACTEINKGEFLKGFYALEEAISKEFAKNGTTPVYLEEQLIRLRAYLEQTGELAPLDQNGTSPATPEIKKAEAPKESEADKLKLAEERKTLEAIGTPKSKPEKPKAATEEPQPKKMENGFTEEQLTDFRNKGIQKVKQLEGYIFQIGSKTTNPSVALAAIDNAVQLFDSEERTVQVSSAKSPSGTMNLKIRPYFKRVRNYNYDQVEIKWADFLLTSNFTKAPDGNYHGYITFQQRFTGMVEGKVVYEDITTKKQEVILKRYEKAIEGKATDNWDIFLGDIKVEQAQGQ